MSSWTECDPLGSDVGADLRSLAKILAGSVALRSEAHGAFLFAPAKPVIEGLVHATLTIEDGVVEPERAAILVFPDEGIEAGSIGELLDGVPDPPLPDRSSAWLCERTTAPAHVVLEIRVSAHDVRSFELHPIHPPRSARSPKPIRKKRREGAGNLKRRSDWFQSGTRRR